MKINVMVWIVYPNCAEGAMKIIDGKAKLVDGQVLRRAGRVSRALSTGCYKNNRKGCTWVWWTWSEKTPGCGKEKHAKTWNTMWLPGSQAVDLEGRKKPQLEFRSVRTLNWDSASTAHACFPAGIVFQGFWLTRCGWLCAFRIPQFPFWLPCR